jgi:hypothetical protein
MEPAAVTALAEKALVCTSAQDVRALVLTLPGALPAQLASAAR